MTAPAASFRDRMIELRRGVLLQAIVEARLNLSQAARTLGVHRNTIDYLCRASGIDVDQLRANYRAIRTMTSAKETAKMDHSSTVTALPADSPRPSPPRYRLPTDRAAVNHKVTIDKVRCYIIVGLYPDGQPGEVFLKVDQVGSTVRGLTDAFSCLFSMALQHGIPLAALINKFEHVKFAPAGMTGSADVDLKFADSIIDYMVRWMKKKFVAGIIKEA